MFDALSGLCQGCGRTLDEIGRWSSLSDVERRAIMARLPGRLVANHEAAERAGR